MTPEQPTGQYVRVMWAVMLCLIAIWLYNFIFPPPRPPRKILPVPALNGPVPNPETKGEEKEAPAAKEEIPEGLAEAALKLLEEEIAVEAFPILTDRFETLWTNEGASLVYLRLRDFYKTTNREDLLEVIPPIEVGRHSLAILGLGDLAERPWKILDRGDGGQIRFEMAAKNGLRVRKTILVPRGDLHHWVVEIEFENPGHEDATFDYLLRGPAGIVKEEQGYGSEPVGLIATTEEGDLTSIGVNKVLEKPFEDARDIAFVGVQNKYFTCLLAPLRLGDRKKYARIDPLEDSALKSKHREQGKNLPLGRLEKLLASARNNVAASLGFRDVVVRPGETVTHRYLFFAGPKKKELLHSYDIAPEGIEEGYVPLQFGRILFQGMTGGISRFFVWVLTGIHWVTGNWGVAIILLTFAVRGALHPLNRKAQKSMHGMSKLKPQMDAIKGKYKGRKSKDSSAKMQKEILGLYKEHGVNPAGGCLPMFLQLPLFIGLYWGINQAVDLRHAPFFLWIDDLSAQDALFDLGFTIPLVATSSFNVLPMLVIASWIAQQKMQPKPADPQMQQQQKIMTYMLFFMGFIFYTVPSGLNLYFMTSAVLGMFENRWIRKQLDLAAPPPPPPSPLKKKKKKPKR